MAQAKKAPGKLPSRSVSKAALKSFLARATALAGPILSEMGLELVLAQAPLAGGRPVIRFFIDRPQGSAGVSLDDCAAVSRALESALEAFEAEAPAGYVMEISSPGLDRPLLKPEDCRRFQGRLARLKLRQSGLLRVFRGRLAPSETGNLALETANGRVEFEWTEVVSGRLTGDEAIL